jgi:tRNA-dihydrouridine synthase
MRGTVALATLFSFYCLPIFVRSFHAQRLGRCFRSSWSDEPTSIAAISQTKKDVARRMQMKINDRNSNQNGTTGNSNNNNCSDRSDLDELFSVAPMMGHTNRHYRYFYRLLSSKTHLYTEMIPASQIWAAYRRAREIYLPTSMRSSSSSTSLEIPHPEEIMEVVNGVIQDPSLEYAAAAHFDDHMLTLHQLLAMSSLSSSSVAKGISEKPVVLQLGGNNPTTLSVASAIGSAWGAAESLAATGTGSTTSTAASSIINPTYTSINLNCGCPSNAVGGRAGGCSLMGTPDLVARSVESMKGSIDDIWDNLEEAGPPPTVTVKNRLGIREAATYDAAKDRSKNDDEAFGDVSSFVRTVSLAGAVPKFHVHTRLGLLGDFREDGEDEERNEGNNNLLGTTKQKLWVPESAASEVPVDRDDDASAETNSPRIKIDHKREQDRARRSSRRATIKNREVPPLRPGVVQRLADAFPHLRFVANGGIDDLDHVKKIVEESQHRSNNSGSVIGAMVGRAAINHPCSFAAADSVLWRSENQAAIRRPTRGEVLEDYIAYCETEESLIESYGASPLQLESLRKRLVAVPFHLFTGEEGSDEFQRRLKKLRDTKMNGRNQNKKKDKKNQIQMKAASILRAASSFVSRETLDKTVDDFVPWEDVAKFEGGLKRGSALQRVVY